MATADRSRGRALAATLTLGATLLAACGGAPGPQRDSAGAVTAAGEVRLLKLREGDCVDNLRSALDDAEGGPNGVPKVRAVPCAALHDGEVLQIKPIADSTYPGPAIIDGEASRGRIELGPRLDRAKQQAGADARRQFSLLTFRPSDDRWDFEHQREIFYLALYNQPRRGRF